MRYYFYTNALGSYIFDESARLVKKKEFSPSYENLRTLSHGDYLNAEISLLDGFKGKEVLSLVRKNSYGWLVKPDFSDKSTEKIFLEITAQFSTNEQFAFLRKIALELSADLLRKYPPKDQMIIQAISALDEMDKTINTLSTRLREWFSLYNPELSRSITDNEHYAKEVLKLEKKKGSIGADISKKDLMPMKELGGSIISVYALRRKHENYLESLVEETYPNVSAVATPLIAARLISYSGSMRRLVGFPSSTIQTLGAEKAMFRHLKTDSKPPKYGIIVLHPLVNNAKQKEKGRVARALASKITIAAKIDFFGGDTHTGYQLREELDKMFM